MAAPVGLPFSYYVLVSGICTCRQLSLYCTWAKGRQMEQPREGRTTQPEGVGVVGGPEELGLEHFLEAFYFPLKLTFITGTMIFSS